MLDGGYWYNRNLVIIANIERQFLLESDQHDIQFYFGKHRTNRNTIISYFKIQAGLAVAIAVLVLVFHFSVRVSPGLGLSIRYFDLSRSLPYIAAIGSIIICLLFARNRRKSYETFVLNSPGISMNTAGVVYGPGHAVDP